MLGMKHHSFGFLVTWNNKHPYCLNQRELGSLFLTPKNLSKTDSSSSFTVLHLLQACCGFPDSLYLVVYKVWIQEMVSHFSLWKALPWNSLNLDSMSCQTHHLFLSICVLIHSTFTESCAGPHTVLYEQDQSQLSRSWECVEETENRWLHDTVLSV